MEGCNTICLQTYTQELDCAKVRQRVIWHALSGRIIEGLVRGWQGRSIPYLEKGGS